ncbi:hypothetical protein F511_42067 [Dorcoceras hygrometricum]|uniref:Uncharacterized protein n=1 Tax=Dorcoceras hygrometricum TaxID=472368 RepID=A0A2Z7AWJ5_9LAMI|nr:hypothetical protein F511_42067 [Dorcoceras hygrometricum]
MRTRADKSPSRKNDRKVLVAEESNKNWADTDTDSSSSSSSSSDSEQEEVHCIMANQTSEDETLEEVKAENVDLENSSVEPRSVQHGNTDSLQIESSLNQNSRDSSCGNRCTELRMRGRAARPHSHLPVGICYPSCAEWLTTTVHELCHGRVSCLMHLVFGCGVKASGSLPHFEHTPWPLFVADLVELCLSSLVPFLVEAFSCSAAGRGFYPAGGAPGGG